MAVPSRILEGIYNSELDAKDYYDKYSKEEIDRGLDEIQKSNIEILNQYKVEDMRAAVEAKLNHKADINKPRKFRIFNYISYAAAAAVLLAVIIPLNMQGGNKTAKPTERTKGVYTAASQQEIKLSLYRQNGSQISKIQTGAHAEEGDVIQITYQAGKENYGIIFSVDGNGNITRHFPENSWTAGQLKHGSEEIPLDFSYELDDAPEFEYFVFVTSEKEFNLDDINKRIKNSKDVEYLQKLNFLPKKTEAVSFVLNK